MKVPPPIKALICSSNSDQDRELEIINPVMFNQLGQSARHLPCPHHKLLLVDLPLLDSNSIMEEVRLKDTRITCKVKVQLL